MVAYDMVGRTSAAEGNAFVLAFLTHLHVVWAFSGPSSAVLVGAEGL